MNKDFIPVSQPDIGEKERAYLLDAFDSGWISSKGQYIEKFEEAWASKNDMKYGSACSSGTTALTLALRALGIGEGDEVIVPDFTMIATAWAVTYVGATPVFVDCKDDLNIVEDLIEDAITPRTKAIMPVHIYGRQCNMEKIMKLAYEYNLRVIEDSAEAHGIKPVGDIACYSFFANKIITTGEGGMCLTNDKRLKDQIDHLRSMAFDLKHTFLHKKIGYNFRMTNMQAAVGLAQVERFDEILAKRKQIEEWYDKYIDERFKMPKRDVLWMYDVNCGDEMQIIKEGLAEKGIDTRYFFKPMTIQPMYDEGDIANYNAFDWSQDGIYLPTFNQLTEDQVKYICKTINELS